MIFSNTLTPLNGIKVAWHPITLLCGSKQWNVPIISLSVSTPDRVYYFKSKFIQNRWFFSDTFRQLFKSLILHFSLKSSCFRVCVIFIAYVSACDFCHSNGFASVCTKEIVCPTNTHVVIVQCYVQEIISNERIGQLLIQGPCNTIEPYIYFCFDNKIFGKL